MSLSVLFINSPEGRFSQTAPQMMFRYYLLALKCLSIMKYLNLNPGEVRIEPM